MLKQKGTVLGCFSPPVMVATFLIEVILALYVIVRYKLNAKTRAIVALLISLGAFQFAEYFVCTQSSIAIGASRAGYIAITALPPIGLYLMALLTKPLPRKALGALTAVTGTIMGYFLLAPRAFEAYQCTGNYVIFQIGDWQAMLYGTFYFGLIAASVIKGMVFLLEKPKAKTVNAIRWLIVGYGVFVIPVAVLVVLHPNTSQAVPSIMCGFAVFLALILGLKLAPLVSKK